VKCSTSHDVWLTLERMFTSHSHARIMQIHYQLATLRKGDSPIADYFHRFTNLADTLAAVDHPLNDIEMISFLLAGLGSDYDSFVTSVNTRVEPLSLEDLYGHLLVHELRLIQNQPSVDLSVATANYAQKGSSNRGAQYIGTSHLFTPHNSFRLNNVLHVPNISQNLLFVQKFTTDTNTFFEFHPKFFYVKD
jgi:hypothetical protein